MKMKNKIINFLEYKNIIGTNERYNQGSKLNRNNDQNLASVRKIYKKKIKYISAASLLLLFILISVFTLSACSSKKIAVKHNMLVTVKHVKTMNAHVYITSPGYFIPYKTADVSSRTAGQIVKIYAHDGNSVHAGEVLAVIDRTKARYTLKAQEALINKDKANLSLALTTLKRDKMLYRKELLTPLEYDAAISNYKIAFSVLNSAKSVLGFDAKNYRDTLIKSLISGVVYKRDINIGDYVAVNKVAYEIVSLKPLELEFHIPQSQIPQIKIGQTVSAEVKGFPNKMFKGKIYFISPQLNPQTRMIRVKALFKNNKLILRPQLFANVYVEVKTIRDGFFVPEAALRTGLTGNFVFIYKNGKAYLKKVKTGITKNGYIQIIKGITKNDFVVVKGSNLVRNGQTVSVAAK
ncbi:MAG: efflux RND transporter periplasmic adaptor subunit [Candidatus Acididesulfobacter guangdongensis]|uniref:Efflux RND transporter periplasmic adaptor subunit n=1 Tax=Acididesulfobacter guangdongensis TaxID=2597225 RepID=A0A519BED3_ACIG2|nr:MAG: efflux RND transporter periplasmic adaptor subunit [Candidatus Acididesulfobacter guangdongensis]